MINATFLLICRNMKRDASPISAPLLANSDEHFRGEELDHHIPAPAGCDRTFPEEEMIAIFIIQRLRHLLFFEINL